MFRRKKKLILITSIMGGMDNSTKNFVNLALDFKEFWVTDLNPLEWSKLMREDFISQVSNKEPDKFKRFGYYIDDKHGLCWDVKLMGK